MVIGGYRWLLLLEMVVGDYRRLDIVTSCYM